YFALLAELGFSIEKDAFGHYKIAGGGEDSYENNFTDEEVFLLKKLLLTAGKKTKLKDGILKKLYVRSSLNSDTNILLKVHLNKIVDTLETAIKEKKQVTLKKYHSTNSNSITDRIVEPIAFTDNYQNLIAFEVKSKTNKYFNIERISGVSLGSKSFQFEKQHEAQQPDVFGFPFSKKQYDIELLLSVRSFVLLKEQYPATEKHIKKVKAGKENSYQFKTTVYNLTPALRFVMGFYDEVTVVGSPELKKALKEKLERLVRG
ncbi:MAG: helix-turn-helix transcriptional regulator, partial [Bacteroidota bacterium]